MAARLSAPGCTGFARTARSITFGRARGSRSCLTVPIRWRKWQPGRHRRNGSRLSSEITAILGPALDELTEMERAAFVLRHYEGHSIEEISAALGVQPGAAKHSVFRAVRKLRQALEPAMSSR